VAIKTKTDWTKIAYCTLRCILALSGDTIVWLLNPLSLW